MGSAASKRDASRGRSRDSRAEKTSRGCRSGSRSTTRPRKGHVASLEFPDGVIVSANSSLQQLALVNVDIANVPKSVYTPQLRSLVLQNCLLKEVPAPVLSLHKLSFLRLDQNDISSLPSAIAKLPLDSLYLSENALTTFPSVISTIPTLKLVELAQNGITNIRRIGAAVRT
ncbi:hypothetical protein PINS_up023400 [Pythium insidiosum]|nr:hypothetical protein PINS_up023400 [Pythium insidiosum]